MEIVEWIKKEYDEKKLLPGAKLYSEYELAEMFSLSRQTIRHAIAVLEEEGMVRRIRGSGTYINDTSADPHEKKTRVAVVTTYVDSYIFPKTIQGIESVLSEKGYSVQIAFTNNQVERECTILEDIISKNDVAGLIIEATKSGLPNPNLSLYETLMKGKVPILFVNSYYPELVAPHVTLDDKYAASSAVRLLIERGHKKIGGIFKLDDGQGRLRYTGYQNALEKAGLSTESSQVIWIDTDDIPELSFSADKIKRRLKDCTAVLCYNDQVARNLIQVLKEKGVRIPEDLSVISIDDSDLATIGEPGIASVPHPVDSLGAKAAENLLQYMKQPTFDATYEFRTEVVLRQSVRDLRQIEE